MKRRRFLQDAIATSMGMLAANSSKMTQAQQAPSASGAPSGVFSGGGDTIKVALVGCGFRGTGAASQVLQTKGPIKLWAMADLFADRLEASYKNLTQGMAKEYDRDPTTGLNAKIDVPPERRFVGFDAYQKAIDSGADLVLLTTHQHFRPMHYAYAVKQGKHVFMEKPLGVDVPGIQQILAANEEAKKKNLKVGVGLYMRHSRRVQETLARVRDGAIGPVVMMSCYFVLRGLHDTPARPPEMTEMTYQLRNPFHFVWLAGDDLVDAVVHYFDVCLWLKGSHPVTSQGQGGRHFYLPNQRGDVFDHQIVEYAFADGTKMFGQTRSINGCWSRSTAQMHGPSGWADTQAGRIEGANPWRWHGLMPNPYQVEHDVLIDAIRQNKPWNDVDHAAEATLVGIMGRMAAYTGQEVTWDQVNRSKQVLAPDKYTFDATPPVVPDETGRYPVGMPGITKVL